MSSPARSLNQALETQSAKPEILSREEGRGFLGEFNDLVDPASCQVELEDDNLTITVRKAEIQSKTGAGRSEGL